jgi:CubicO group peptidase (beta-lactamase class C family)
LRKSIPVWFLLLFLSSCYVGDYLYYNLPGLSDVSSFPTVTVHPGKDVWEILKSKNIDNQLFVFNDGHGKSPTTLPDYLASTKSVAFLVLHNDSLVFQWFAKGFGDTTVLPSFSIAKSMVSALVGIAIEQGMIASVDDSVGKYLPWIKDSVTKQVTIKQLLNMQSGLAYNERAIHPFGNVAKFYYGDDLKKHTKNLKSKGNAGQNVRYQSANTQVLGMILEEATGKPLYTLLEENIWIPAGMKHPAYWSVDDEEKLQVKAFCCLNTNVFEFARFGLLYLNNGIRDHDTIIPPSWIEETISAKNPRQDNPEYRYGYHWRLVAGTDDYFAKGVLGQYIYISPPAQTVIVRIGKTVGKVEWEALFREIIDQMHWNLQPDPHKNLPAQDSTSSHVQSSQDK